MKHIIFILAAFFVISECNADSRILEELRSKASAKANVLKHKKLKKRVRSVSGISKGKKQKEAVKPKERVTSEELDIRNNVAYLPNEVKPFTGKHVEYHPNKKKYIEIPYIDGKKNGLVIMWDEYGHKVGEIKFITGIQEDN